MTEETIKQILKFRDDRDWKQFHNPKDLAISISLEAAELLEVFQWSGTDVSNEGKQERIKEELADVLNYCVLMADACGLDIDEIVQEKINNKQFSAVGDELIMGRWLKGRLAAAGIVKPVNNTAADTDRLGMITEEMLQEYGCDRLEFKKTGQTALDEDGDPLDVWMLSFTAGSEEE